jgi:hypothetical protein
MQLDPLNVAYEYIKVVVLGQLVQLVIHKYRNCKSRPCPSVQSVQAQAHCVHELPALIGS